MKKIISLLFLAVLPAVTLAAGGGGPLMKASIDPMNEASLQRGAQAYVNYCLGCHSLKYMRYNRLSQDLGISERQVIDNMMFTQDKIGNPMDIVMTPDDAKTWFGQIPPDLSLIVRVKGEDWLYTYLKGFYSDPDKVYGVNNIVFPDVGMPHVLWSLQGLQKAVYKTETDEDGTEHKVFDHFEKVSEGTLNDDEYDQLANDLVNFMSYAAEPVKIKRQQMGLGVLFFIMLFGVLAYFLKKEYWKDIH